MLLAILKSFQALDHLIQQYEEACVFLKVKYIVVDLFKADWIDVLKNEKPNGCLVRVKGNINEHKQYFDEILFVINKILKIPIYPSYDELFIYENKRMYYYWLESNNFPHVKTDVLFSKQLALTTIENLEFPVVFKTNGGASSSGVRIIKSKSKAKLICHQVFGLFDERLAFGSIPWRKKNFPLPKFGQIQKHYLIIQEFVKIRWEWRIIKIGNSYFGHKKLLKGNYASGSNLVGWEAPPINLLILVKEICEVGKFDSMAVDIFETDNSEYYINEMQSLFGSFLPYQMKIENIPGRYISQNNSFVFEQGEFNKFGSNLLRVEDFVEKLNNGYYHFSR